MTRPNRLAWILIACLLFWLAVLWIVWK